MLSHPSVNVSIVVILPPVSTVGILPPHALALYSCLNACVVSPLQWLRRQRGSEYEEGIGRRGDNDDGVDYEATTLLEYSPSAVEAAAAGGHIQVKQEKHEC